MAVAAAQRDDSGRKIVMTVRTLKGMLGSEETYGRSEKIANWSSVIVCHNKCHTFKIFW